MSIIDTHAHLDGEEYANDLQEVMQRAQDAGVTKVFLPAINLSSVETILQVCQQYPTMAYPMIGLHPEEVNPDYPQQLQVMHQMLAGDHPFIAIGEVGLDYYWSREYEHEQLQAFQQQVEWSVETGLPLMIHCRKAQNEMVKLLRPYERELPGGVFHCFTGNEHEATELLQFERFALGIGGVLTFKKSHLPEVLPAAVPLNRIVLETDSPYMAPVPHRGTRNESAYVTQVLSKLAECYQVNEQEVAQTTNRTVASIFKRVALNSHL